MRDNSYLTIANIFISQNGSECNLRWNFPEGACPQTLLAWATFGSWGGINKLAIRCLSKAWWPGYIKSALFDPGWCSTNEWIIRLPFAMLNNFPSACTYLNKYLLPWCFSFTTIILTESGKSIPLQWPSGPGEAILHWSGKFWVFWV